MRFCFVSERSVPEETGRLLSQSCEQRGIEFLEVEGRSFDYAPARRLRAGDLLYRGAISTAATRTEQFLYAPGVATFHAGADAFRSATVAPPFLYQQTGVPTPRTVSASSDQVALLTTLVEQVGGFPVVLKVLGRSSGVGVMLLESMPSLVSIVSYALSQRDHPLLCQFIPDAIHWRLIVVGDTVVAHYRNEYRPGDFRTDGSANPADFQTTLPTPVGAAAVLAVKVQHLEFAGVDVLEDAAGHPYVLEANFPCYYPHAQLKAGVDISGKMIDHLMAKSRRRHHAREARRE